MTAVEPSATAPAVRVAWRSGPRRSPVGAWRVAARLARREVRRRPGRSALVAALVALPIFAMTVGVVLARTDAAESQNRFLIEHGAAADLVLFRSPGDISDERLAELLPPGTRWARERAAGGQIRTEGEAPRATYATVTQLDLEDPVNSGLIEIRSGHSPGPGEVIVSEAAADALGVGVGDTLTLARPDVSWRVVGIGRRASAYGATELAVSSFDWQLVQPGADSETIRIDVPGRPGAEAQAAHLETLKGNGQIRSEVEWFDGRPPEVDRSALAWGWIAGALALAAVGVVISAAFATGARRQLVTIGQLSAQGASPRLVRRTLALQGSWTGLVGSATGIAAALAALVVGRTLIEEEIRGQAMGPYVVRGGDLLVLIVTGVAAATLAALVPARSAARIPVLTALSGRRPLARVPRWLVPIGAALFAGGLLLLALVGIVASAPAEGGPQGASEDLLALAGVLGGLGVLAGMCCSSPLVVDGVGSVGAGLRGSWRLAARSVARARTRSAGVVTAIGVAGAAAVVISTMAVSLIQADATSDEIYDQPRWPRDVVALISYPEWGDAGPIDPLEPRPPDPATVGAVSDIVSGIRFSPLRAAAHAPRPEGTGQLTGAAFLVADPPLLDALGLSGRDAATLADEGAVVMEGTIVGDDPYDDEEPPARIEVTLDTVDGPIPLDLAQTRDLPQTRAGDVTVVITEERAQELGLTLIEVGALGQAPGPITLAQQARLDALRVWDTTFVTPGEPVGPESTAVFQEIDWETTNSDREPSPAVVQAAIVAAALGIVLVVVAIGLGLAAAEGREERDILVAVGAKPVTLRRMAGVKAVVLTAAGVAVAVPTGLAPSAVILATTESAPIVVPWVALGLLVTVTPLLAGGAAWAVSSIAQRARPPRASTLAVD